MLADLGLEPKASKTRIVHLEEGGEGFDFLGFHHRWVRARSRRHRNVTFLARWPSDKAMRHLRDRVRELTATKRGLLPIEDIVKDLNRVLSGWANYFRYGNSSRHLDKARSHALERLVLHVARRHKRPRSHGRRVAHAGNQLGLVSLSGIVVAPRPRWVSRPNAGGERRR